MRTYDISLRASGGEALSALLAEWDLDGLVVEIVLRGATLRPETLAAVLQRAAALGVTVTDVQDRET
jgi:hypothetical protein